MATTGATATAIDWTLSAAGPATITGVTGDTAITAAVVPVGTYTLTETNGPTGYTPSDWVCVGGTPGTGQITLAPGDRATCHVANTAIVPTLTLVKVVDNGTTGATAVPTDWILTADGPVVVSGRSGDGTITAAPVQVGDYVLSEADGPAGYLPSDWVCVGAPVANGTVSVGLGQVGDVHDHEYGGCADVDVGEGGDEQRWWFGGADGLVVVGCGWGDDPGSCG